MKVMNNSLRRGITLTMKAMNNSLRRGITLTMKAMNNSLRRARTLAVPPLATETNFPCVQIFSSDFSQF